MSTSILSLEEEMGSGPFILTHQNIPAEEIQAVKLVENGRFQDEERISVAVAEGFQVMTIAFIREHGNVGGETAHRLVTVLVKRMVTT